MVLGVFGGVFLRLRGGGTARPRRRDWPVNFAHRGDSSGAPENTLPAFALGLKGGAGGIETDVHLSRDGELAVIHDPTLDRTTDGGGEVGERDYPQLLALDAGYYFTLDGATFPYRGAGARIPSLREVYETFPGVFVNAEIKSSAPGTEERLLAEILAAGAGERTLVASARHEGIVRFRRLSGGRVATSASRLEILVFYLAAKFGLWRFIRPDYAALQVPVRLGNLEVVTPGFLQAARSVGVRVDVWTVNDRAEMRRMLDLGVDVVMTDRPAELAEVLRERRRGGYELPEDVD